jgi:hypothetical protein
MFSDAALAIAVDTSTKWLYNASRRLKRPLRRSLEDAVWWRLTHHLAGRLGIPLADAARASDLLLAQGSDLSRVRLRSTEDDTVAVSVELSRFHDGAALAAAAALHLATPRRRGRPPRDRSGSRSVAAFQETSPAADDSVRLARALSAVRSSMGGENGLSPVQILASITEAGVPFVVSGGVAGVFHGVRGEVDSLELVADPNARHARSLAHLLNRLGARPRSVHFREGFRLDSSLIRAAPCLSLRVAGIALNVTWSVPGVGEFPQVQEASRLVSLENFSCSVISRESFTRSVTGLARLTSPA